ncbi:MAG: hypothetical protein B7X53_15580 [Hyphomonas sp. 34-62-18]|nr:MAG: hypothetical protein B7X53_15580 [Hyphomonas sp. 34-62-18]
MLHGVDAIRAADGGFGRDGGIAFEPGRIADGIAIREVGADIDLIGKLLAAMMTTLPEARARSVVRS